MSDALNSLLLQWNRCVASTMSDGDLLRSYLRNHAEEPFRLLVERHGGMVLGVCRHRLGDAHAAEDAFQATFLLLAHRANSIRRPESVAAWLHRTAIRICAKVQRAEKRRRSREVTLTTDAAREESYTTSGSTSDVLIALEEEVERLPERYRTPLLLCYWQGMTQAEAARCLGCSEGSIKARLERGRKQLAKRLTQRGLAPRAILIAPLAGSKVPPELLTRTMALTPKGATIPTEVAMLVKGVSASLGSTTRYVVGALVTVVAFTLGGSAMREPQRAEAPAQPAAPKGERKPAAAPLPEGAIARIGSPRLRHAGEVAAVAFSTDGRWLASASPDDQDRSVRVWDLTDGAEKLRISIEENPIRFSDVYRVVAVGFSKDSQHLRVIDFASYRVIDRATGRQVLQHRFHDKAPRPGRDPSNIIGAAFSPDLSIYGVVRQNGELILGDAASGKVRRTIAKVFVKKEYQFSIANPLIFSGDGRRVCIPIKSDTVKVFDTATGNVINTLNLKQSECWAAFLKRGEELAYLAKDGAKDIVEVLNVADGKKLRQIPVEMWARCLDVSPDGKFLAVGNLQRFCVQLLDPLTGKEIRRIPHPAWSDRLVFSPDSKLLAGSRYYFSGTVTVWETASGKRLPSSADEVYLNGFDRDGRLVLWVDDRLRITDWRTGRVYGDLAVRYGGVNYATTYSPDYRLKACYTSGFMVDWKPEKGFPITVRDAATDKEISRLVGSTDFCQSMAFTNDSKRLITISQDAVIRLWDNASGKQLWAEKQPVRFQFRGTGDPHLSADDRRLAVLCVRSDRPKEMELRVWDLVTKKRITAIPTPYLFFGGIDFSPDGKLLAGGGSEDLPDSEDKGTVFVWDVDAGKIRWQLTGHSPGDISCRFAPDGRTLSTVDRTGLIRIWELATGRERFRITGHRGRTDAYFSPDSALIAGWSYEAPVLIWDLYGISRPAEPFDAEVAWQALKDDDAARSFTAMRRLCAAPERAVKLLRQKLKPVEKVEVEAIHKWIRDLDNDDFKTREAAQKSLEKLGDRAVEFMRAALRQSPSAELRARLNRLLKALDSRTPDQLRQQRAVEVLERIGSAQAKAIVADLARGAAGARLTIEAEASLMRWKQHE
jgi:RNA polymerase sigma factor (sigma-70 family)